MSIRYTPSALADIDEIFAYIEADNPAAAAAVVTRVRHTISLIESHPLIGRIKYRSHIRMIPVRRYPPYVVFYAIDDSGVVVLNVRHCARRSPWDDDR